MFGGIKKCDEQIRADEAFLTECDQSFYDRNEASQYYSNRGWDYFHKNDLDTAMMRFNQAWLLDSTNADVYWGFGNILGSQKKFEQSIIYFDKSLSINSDNSNVWLSSGTSYGQLFFQTQDTLLLNEAISNLKKSISLDPKNALSYGQLTVCYFYLMEKDSARKYLEIADRLDPNAIHPEVRQLLNEN